MSKRWGTVNHLRRKSEASQSCLVCWLPVADEVRTRILYLSREFVIPAMII
jgi:hypothetical protein